MPKTPLLEWGCRYVRAMLPCQMKSNFSRKFLIESFLSNKGHDLITSKIITKLCNYLKENTSSNMYLYYLYKKLDLIISKKPYSLCHTFQTSTFFIAFFFSFQQSFFSFNLLMQHRCTYFTESFLMAREKKSFFLVLEKVNQDTILK